MTNEATMEKMQIMRLTGMLNAFRSSLQTGFNRDLTTDELIAHLIDAEWDERHNRKLARLLKLANFRYKATIEQIDFKHQRNLDKNLLLRLSAPDWIKKAENLLITGPTGVGKSFVASAIGHQAALNDFKVLYFNILRLFSKLKYAKADGTYVKELKKIKGQNLIILDDFGLHPVDEQSKLLLL